MATKKGFIQRKIDKKKAEIKRKIRASIRRKRKAAMRRLGRAVWGKCNQCHKTNRPLHTCRRKLSATQKKRLPANQ